jgi:segregation and condensation protein B
MERTRQKQIVEALIIASGEPITAARIADVVPHLKPAAARALVAELANEYTEQERGVEIWEVAGGYQVRTRQDLANYVKQLQKERPARLSRAAIETLSVVAYKQPVTRAEVEQVRGVEVGPVMRSLVERDLIRIAGHREVPGRPIVYASTKRFLELFGLKSLDDLPTLREIEELLPKEEEAGTPMEAATASDGEDLVEAESPAESHDAEDEDAEEDAEGTDEGVAAAAESEPERSEPASDLH